MTRIRFAWLFAVLALAGAFAAGCSAHQNPPATPVDTAATPTNRSFVNSTDVPNTPYYTQPGVNPGKVVQLKPIPSESGFSQNTPLASSVHDALVLNKDLDSRYIAAESKGNQVMLVGSVQNSRQRATAAAIAKSVKGVSVVIDSLTVSGAKSSS